MQDKPITVADIRFFIGPLVGFCHEESTRENNLNQLAQDIYRHFVAPGESKLTATNNLLREAQDSMQTFIDRVDKGEVRSVKSYAMFKATLGKIKGGGM